MARQLTNARTETMKKTFTSFKIYMGKYKYV